MTARKKKANARTPDQAYTLATVRVADAAAQGRWVKLPYATLMQMYTGYVKVAASRNATAIARMRIRIFSRSSSSYGYSRRLLPDKERAQIVNRAGLILRSAYGDDTADMVEITDRAHPVMSFFRQPNPSCSGFDLIERFALHLGLVGNAYGLIIRDGPMPVQWWALSPQYVRAIPDRERFISTYVYGTGVEIEKNYDADSVVHFLNPNPLGDPYYGMGDLAACSTQAELMQAFTQFAQATIDNGGQPGLVITVPGATASEREQMEANLNAKAAGAHNAGRSLVLSGPEGMGIEKWATDQKEMSFLQSSDSVREIIANCFDLPIALLTLQDAALATAQAGLRHWHEFGILPRKQRIEDKINARLMPMFSEAIGEELYLTLDMPQGDQRESEVAEAVQLVGAGILTRSAAASRLGIKQEDVPADPAGEMQEGSEGSDTAAPPIDTARASGIVETLKAVADGTLAPDAAHVVLVSCYAVSDADAAAMVSGQETAARQKREEAEAARKSEIAAPQEPKEIDRTAPLESAPAVVVPPAPAVEVLVSGMNCDSVERRLEDGPDGDSLRAIAARMAAGISRWLERIRPAVEASFDPDGAQVSDVDLMDPTLISEYSSTVRPHTQAAVDIGWDRGAAQASERGATIQASIGDRAAAVLEQREMATIQSIGSTMTKQVRESLAEGVRAGESIPMLTQRVREVAGLPADYRAEAIARYETSKAYGIGRREAWKESGIVSGREWLLSGNPCPLCEALAARFQNAPLGEVMIPKGGTFTDTSGKVYRFDYEALDGAPAHPGCGCTEGAVFKEYP